jgi:hypothetical protein
MSLLSGLVLRLGRFLQRLDFLNVPLELSSVGTPQLVGFLYTAFRSFGTHIFLDGSR